MGAGSTLKREPLGIIKIEALHYYVRDLERTRRFFVDKLDFAELGHSSPELDREGRQRAAAFAAGDAVFVIHQPMGEGGRAWRYLRKHPEGVGTLVFEVEDIDRAFALLDERGGTFITDVQRFADDGGTLAMFSITTPFGDTTFRFIERRGYRALFPGFVPAPRVPGDRRQPFRVHPHRSRHLQLPDHEAGAALDGARPRLRAVLGDRVSHQRRRRRGREARPRVGAEVGGDVGSRTRGSSSPTTSRSGPSSRSRRSTSSPRTTAATASSTRRWRCATSSGACAACAARRSSSCRRPAATSTCCPNACAGSASAPSTRASTTLRELEILVDGERPAAVPAADLPQGGGRPAPRSGGGPVLLRDHPAQGRPGLRRRQLPRAVRGHRARPDRVARDVKAKTR